MVVLLLVARGHLKNYLPVQAFHHHQTELDVPRRQRLEEDLFVPMRFQDLVDEALFGEASQGFTISEHLT